MADFGSPLTFARGARMANRFMLAPMTNRQSHDDGTLSDEELHWLKMRAMGGFGSVMTCAANVQRNGKTWPGELGVYDDALLPGLKSLAAALSEQGTLSIVQIFHGGMRAPSDLIGGETPVAPSEDEETGARALSTLEVETLRDDFITAAKRCEVAGFDGIELHGAHGYLLCQFLSAETNRRSDRYGGTAENRARLLIEILDGIQEVCSKDFCIGVRLSPEGMGLDFQEMLDLSQNLMGSGRIDFLDASLWDCAGFPKSEGFEHKRLIEWYSELPRGKARLGVAGKLGNGASVQAVFQAGVDFVLIGRAGILNHDLPRKMIENPNFEPRTTPVSRAILAEEGLSPKFIDYMSRWDGFVAD